MATSDDENMDRKPGADRSSPRKRSRSPQKSRGNKPGSVPVTPHTRKATAKLSPRMNSPLCFSPLSLKAATFSPTPWPKEQQVLLPPMQQLLPPPLPHQDDQQQQQPLASPPPCHNNMAPPPPTNDFLYVKIPHRDTMGFTAKTWWLVDLQHEPALQCGATPVVARCLFANNWTEALCRRVLRGYQQFLALAAEAEDWRGQLLLPPPLVDQMWSVHIQMDTAAYCHDCMILCGQVLSRAMDGSTQDQRQTRTLQRLKLRFGNDYNPEIWDYNEPAVEKKSEGFAKSTSESAKHAASASNNAAVNLEEVTKAAEHSKPLAVTGEGITNKTAESTIKPAVDRGVAKGGHTSKPPALTVRLGPGIAQKTIKPRRVSARNMAAAAQREAVAKAVEQSTQVAPTEAGEGIPDKTESPTSSVNNREGVAKGATENFMPLAATEKGIANIKTESAKKPAAVNQGPPPENPVAANTAGANPPVKRGRGRPRKHPIAAGAATVKSICPKRGPGRPRKNPIAVAITENVETACKTESAIKPAFAANREGEPIAAEHSAALPDKRKRGRPKNVSVTAGAVNSKPVFKNARVQYERLPLPDGDDDRTVTLLPELKAQAALDIQNTNGSCNGIVEDATPVGQGNSTAAAAAAEAQDDPQNSGNNTRKAPLAGTENGRANKTESATKPAAAAVNRRPENPVAATTTVCANPRKHPIAAEAAVKTSSPKSYPGRPRESSIADRVTKGADNSTPVVVIDKEGGIGNKTESAKHASPANREVVPTKAVEQSKPISATQGLSSVRTPKNPELDQTEHTEVTGNTSERMQNVIETNDSSAKTIDTVVGLSPASSKEMDTSKTLTEYQISLKKQKTTKDKLRVITDMISINALISERPREAEPSKFFSRVQKVARCLQTCHNGSIDSFCLASPKLAVSCYNCPNGKDHDGVATPEKHSKPPVSDTEKRKRGRPKKGSVAAGAANSKPVVKNVRVQDDTGRLPLLEGDGDRAVTLLPELTAQATPELTAQAAPELTAQAAQDVQNNNNGSCNETVEETTTVRQGNITAVEAQDGPKDVGNNKRKDGEGSSTADAAEKQDDPKDLGNNKRKGGEGNSTAAAAEAQDGPRHSGNNKRKGGVSKELNSLKVWSTMLTYPGDPEKRDGRGGEMVLFSFNGTNPRGQKRRRSTRNLGNQEFHYRP